MLWGEISNLYEIESFQIKTYQSNMGTSLIENFLGLPFPISFSEILFFRYQSPAYDNSGLIVVHHHNIKELLLSLRLREPTENLK